MIQYIEQDNITYGFVKNYEYDEALRSSFNRLTEATFKFSLENWYQRGFWSDRYVPYSLLHDNKVISNISVNLIELDFENKRKFGVQIGTVMTDENYRHRGLNRFLMQQVLNDWKDCSDFIYLFANDSVLDFYPKFNFSMVHEFQYSKSISANNVSSAIKKLDIDDKNDVALLVDTIEKSIPMAKLSMRNNAALIMFYCLSYKKNSIFYLEDFNTVVIADHEGDLLYLNDVFCKSPIELNDIIQSMSSTNTKRVVLGFTPKDEEDYNRQLLTEGDTLFVLKDGIDHFKGKQWMFPVLSHA